MKKRLAVLAAALVVAFLSPQGLGQIGSFFHSYRQLPLGMDYAPFDSNRVYVYTIPDNNTHMGGVVEVRWNGSGWATTDTLYWAEFGAGRIALSPNGSELSWMTNAVNNQVKIFRLVSGGQPEFLGQFLKNSWEADIFIPMDGSVWYYSGSNNIISEIYPPGGVALPFQGGFRSFFRFADTLYAVGTGEIGRFLLVQHSVGGTADPPTGCGGCLVI